MRDRLVQCSSCSVFLRTVNDLTSTVLWLLLADKVRFHRWILEHPWTVSAFIMHFKWTTWLVLELSQTTCPRTVSEVMDTALSEELDVCNVQVSRQLSTISRAAFYWNHWLVQCSSPSMNLAMLLSSQAMRPWTVTVFMDTAVTALDLCNAQVNQCTLKLLTLSRAPF